MFRYVILSHSLTDEVVQSATEDCYKVFDNAWIVLSDQDTCAGLCTALRMENESGNNGVVVKFNEYYGLFNPALWQKLDVWGAKL